VSLSGKRILIMATNGFEESELFGPREILLNLGARVLIASPTLSPIHATVLDKPGKSIQPDMLIADARAEDFDALILPGGVINPDALRTNAEAIALIRSFLASGQPVGAICHGPWLLVEADALRGRIATCWPSIRTDLRNAGAILADQAAVTDGNIVTSRMPEDVPEFTKAVVRLIEG
jgi:protease I